MSFSLFNILNDFIVSTSLFNRNKSFCKVNFVSYSLARLNIKDVRHNKFAMIILGYYDINM